MQGMNVLTGQPISDIEHLKQSIRDILSTPIGSRVMRRDYGSRLFQRIDQPITGALIAEIYADVVESLFNFEPRFEVSNVSVISATNGQLILSLDGKYIPTNEQVQIGGILIK